LNSLLEKGWRKLQMSRSPSSPLAQWAMPRLGFEKPFFCLGKKALGKLKPLTGTHFAWAQWVIALTGI